MRNDLTAALSEFSQLKSNCFPCLHRPRKPTLRMFNSTELQVLNIPLAMPNPKHPSASQINTRCRKILHDQRVVNQRKLADHNSLFPAQSTAKDTLMSSQMEMRVKVGSQYLERRQTRFAQLFAMHLGEAAGGTPQKDRTDHQAEKCEVKMLTVTKLYGKDLEKKHKPKFFSAIRKKPYIKIPTSKTAQSSTQTSPNQSRNSPRKFLQSPTRHRDTTVSSPNTKLSMSIQKQKRKPFQTSFFEQDCNEQTVEFHLQSTIDDIVIRKDLFENIEDFKGEVQNQAFSITHRKNNEYTCLAEFNPDSRMEIASLTKIMTCLLVLMIAEKFKIDLRHAYAKVGHKAASLQGTTAKLLYADVVCVWDLLHGMMLPSGNDAAQTLAEWGGKAIRACCGRHLSRASPRKIKLIKLGQAFKKTPIGLFIYHMNTLSKVLSLVNTRFANVHGLINKKNYSCSSDLTKLCIYAMQRHDFRSIVVRRQYICTIQNKKYANKRIVSWSNTNKLLKLEMFCGIKTGMTPSAGPCLASCFRVSPEQSVYIVLLNTLTVTHRFEESKRLLVTALKRMYERTGNRLYVSGLQGVTDQNLDILPGEDNNQDSNNFEPSEDTEVFEEDRMAELQV